MHFLKLQVQYGGDINELILPTKSSDPSVEELQKYIERQLNIPTCEQRIIFKGQSLHEKPDEKLRFYGVTNASLIRVVGCKQKIQD